MKNKVKNYVGYYRVSTDGQGKSGLGLSAQRKAVLDYIDRNGQKGKAKIVKEFKEVESGRKDDRPVLSQAITFCKENNACLVVAKLDRLARSVWLFSNIQKAGIDFEIVGLPKNPLVQNVLASVAEWEAKAISQRTKSALAVKKAQGVKLGYHRKEVKRGLKNYWKAKKKEIASRPKPPVIKKLSAKQIADKAVLPHIRLLRKQGQTWAQVTETLNETGLVARYGGEWSLRQVWRVAKRNQVA